MGFFYAFYKPFRRCVEFRYERLQRILTAYSYFERRLFMKCCLLTAINEIFHGASKSSSYLMKFEVGECD